MKSAYLGAIALLAFTGQALAADVEPVPEAYDWTGFYVGANIGYAFSEDDEIAATTPAGAETVFEDLSPDGINGGLQLGYNFQFDSIVFGLEADAQIGDIDDDFNDVVGTAPGSIGTASKEIDFFGTVRGRLGFAWDRVLIYGTGGFAWAQVEYELEILDAAGATISWDEDNTEIGYTVGGGLEFAVDDDVTVKAEYLYVDLGSETHENDSSVPAGLTGFDSEIETVFHVVRAGINWRF